MIYYANTCSCCGATVFPSPHEHWPISCGNCRAAYVRGVMLRRQSADRPVVGPSQTEDEAA